MVNLWLDKTKTEGVALESDFAPYHHQCAELQNESGQSVCCTDESLKKDLFEPPTCGSWPLIFNSPTKIFICIWVAGAHFGTWFLEKVPVVETAYKAPFPHSLMAVWPFLSVWVCIFIQKAPSFDLKDCSAYLFSVPVEKRPNKACFPDKQPVKPGKFEKVIVCTVCGRLSISRCKAGSNEGRRVAPLTNFECSKILGIKHKIRLNNMKSNL